MKIVKCDLCDKEVNDSITIEVLDGEHPHNGSAMYKTIDCCFDCAKRLTELKCNVELYDLRDSIK